MTRVTLDQLNIVCGDPAASIAFYRRLGVDIPDEAVWRTPTGIHHVGASDRSGEQAIHLDLDSSPFAQIWNAGWADRDDLRGRVVVGFRVPTRVAVDEIYRDMTGAGYRGLQQPYDAFWGARYAVIEDPDGVAVGVMSPIEPDRKSPPPRV
jgi:catechol 2,3-dioxygenase-like lactoylglutathione lyase family enzyme